MCPAQSLFIECRSFPRTILFETIKDYADRMRGFYDADAGWIFKNNFMAGIHFSYNKDYLDFPTYYYNTNPLNAFWEQSYTSGIFLKKEIFSLKNSSDTKEDEDNNCLIAGAYLFYTHSEIQQAIIVSDFYKTYQYPNNINENKFSGSLQISYWMKLIGNLKFEPGLQFGYYKINPNAKSERGNNYISGQGYEIGNNNFTMNITFSLLYKIH